MRFGILGSGSWGTALAKILTDNGNTIYWWHRDEAAMECIQTRHHNLHYLSTAQLDVSKLKLTTDASEVIDKSDCIVIAIPSAYAVEALKNLDKNIFAGKKIISAIKGILPEKNVLLNDYLEKEFGLPMKDYFAVLGPCHAEEVAAEKLSYLTFSGIDVNTTNDIATFFKTNYLKTVVNYDVYGVQYAAVLKNIYALGAGIAHGLDYGDNFLSVFIANSADEMAGFLRVKTVNGRQSTDHGPRTMDDGRWTTNDGRPTTNDQQPTTINHEPSAVNYAASVYLGDLLVTCYSLHSRNRSFGNMIGKGYSVRAAQLEMNMVAEGYNASKCMHLINETVQAKMPIADTIFKILWENLPVKYAFKQIENFLE